MNKLTAEEIGQKILDLVPDGYEVADFRCVVPGEKYLMGGYPYGWHEGGATQGQFPILRKKQRPQDSIREADCCATCLHVTRRGKIEASCDLGTGPGALWSVCDLWEKRP